MYKKVSILFVLSLAFILALGSSLPARTVIAQAEVAAPDTVVSDDGSVASEALAPEIGLRSVEPFKGSGVLPAEVEPEVAEQGGQLAPRNMPFPGSVIGADGRTRVTATTTYPYRAIAHLEGWFPNGAGYTCTGWFIGPRTVATAGHCVYSKSDGGWAKTLKVYPGRNGSTKPYGYTNKYRLFSVVGWTTNASPDYDYAAIQTVSTLGNTVGWFGFRWQSSNSFPGTFTVDGYPGDKTYGTQWKMSGAISLATTYHLWYLMDTYGGQSGGPLYQTYNGACCYGVGVHTYGVGLQGRNYNSATRIRQAVFNNFVTWKNKPYP